MATIIIAISIGAIGGTIATNGASSTFSKINRISQSNNQDARFHIYNIAFKIFKDSPFFGHGMGSFINTFQMARINYYEENPDYVLDNGRFTHPHNEILFWLDEGGILSIIPILLVAIAVALQVKNTRRKGLSIFALTIPILLHSQVEFPFYLSSIHWILFLFIFSCLFNLDTKEKNIKITTSAMSSSVISLTLIPIITTLFMAHTQVASMGLTLYSYAKPKTLRYLSVAQNDFYFSRIAEQEIYRSLFISQVQMNQHYQMSAFINWANKHLMKYMEKGTFIALSKAYLYQGNTEKAVETISLGSSIYPSDVDLLSQKLLILEQSRQKNPDITAPVPQRLIDAARKAIDPSHVPYNTTPK